MERVITNTLYLKSISKQMKMTSTHHEPVDFELKEIHQAAITLYNRETTILQSKPTSLDSINATNFLAGQAIKFGDAALILMEDLTQPLDVPNALLRTCLEAQARANHIIAVTSKDRESRANELIQLMDKGHDYYEKQCIQLSKEMLSDESKLMPRDRPYLASLKSVLWKTDTTNLKKLKKQYEELNRKWSYGKVVDKDKFSDPASLKRSEAQPLQPGLHLAYLQSCAFVHSDPASIKHAQLVTKVGVTHTIVLAEVIAIACFFLALGKEKDPNLVEVKRRLIAFDINERVLPKEHLPFA